MYCLDANVWIYYFDSGLAEHGAVHDPVTDLLIDEPIFTTSVLQMEVVHYLVNQLAERDTAVDRFLSLEDVVTADLRSEDVENAADLLSEYDEVGIGGRDATVLAAMDRHEVDRLWTDDGGLKRLDDRIEWLTVSDPVEQ